MAVRVKLAKAEGGARGLGYRLLRGVVLAVLVCVIVVACLCGYCYVKYQKVVDERLAAGPTFANQAQMYAAPREVRVGQQLTAQFIAQDLRRAGYNANPQLGTFEVHGESITIKPGPQSYHSTDGATITTGVTQSAADAIAVGDAPAAGGMRCSRLRRRMGLRWRRISWSRS